MKNVSVIGFILAVCLILSGCSYGTQFVVVNNSTAQIEIEFAVIENVNSIEHTEMKPYKTSTSEWNKWFGQTEWQEVPQKNYEFSPESHVAKISLNPNEVLRIAFALHHETTLPTENYEFPIKSICLRGLLRRNRIQRKRILQTV